MHVLILGKGKLGQAVANKCAELKIRQSLDFGDGDTRVDPEDDDAIPHIVIYCGKGNKWEHALEHCSLQTVPLINASTDVKDPVNPMFPYIKVPNACLEMVAFMDAFIPFAQTLRDRAMMLDIVESHQSGKTSKSGTARAIAQKLKMSEEVIIDVRKEGLQRVLGIPENILAKHASHYFVFTSKSGVRIKVTTEVTTHDAYAAGILTIARNVLAENSKTPLDRRVYSASLFI